MKNLSLFLMVVFGGTFAQATGLGDMNFDYCGKVKDVAPFAVCFGKFEGQEPLFMVIAADSEMTDQAAGVYRLSEGYKTGKIHMTFEGSFLSGEFNKSQKPSNPNISVTFGRFGQKIPVIFDLDGRVAKGEVQRVR